MGDTAGYQYLDHVSDVRLRAWGSSLEETFTQACLGMWALVTGASAVPLLRTWAVTAEGADYEELLVNFLNEQILMLDTEGLVAKRVERLTAAGVPGSFQVCVELSGSLASDLAVPPARYVKAATFSDLLVSSTRIDVTLDV